jgi:hypothetical protein
LVPNDFRARNSTDVRHRLGRPWRLATNPTLSPSTGQAGSYQCWRNAYDCSDFRTHAQAQADYNACGGLWNDVNRLDRDRDGQACERLP